MKDRTTQKEEALVNSEYRTPTSIKVIHWNTFSMKKTHRVTTVRRMKSQQVKHEATGNWKKGWLKALQSNKHPKDGVRRDTDADYPAGYKIETRPELIQFSKSTENRISAKQNWSLHERGFQPIWSFHWYSLLFLLKRTTMRNWRSLCRETLIHQLVAEDKNNRPITLSTYIVCSKRKIRNAENILHEQKTSTENELGESETGKGHHYTGLTSITTKIKLYYRACPSAVTLTGLSVNCQSLRAGSATSNALLWQRVLKHFLL